ncbi:MAG: extracellular solute-binding protein [Lachnospiraceae bacterium]|jgi:ABC-type glycerol-3-phosphate transport system substrate-binding protein|nr:extracellular solute-binding protein [Lachnospiraceae bacterium]
MTKIIRLLILLFISLFLISLLLSLFLFACSKEIADETDSIVPLPDITAYLAELVEIPHDSFHCTAVYQDVLYYITDNDLTTTTTDTTTSNSTDTPTLTLVRINLPDLKTSTDTSSDITPAGVPAGTPAGDPVLIPLNIPLPAVTPGLTLPYMMLAIDMSGGIHLLLYQYDAGGAIEVAASYWYQLDESGQLLRTLDIGNHVAGGHHSAITDFLIGGCGNAFIAKDNQLHIIVPDGETAFAINYDGRNASIYKNDSEVGVLYYGAGNRYQLATVDTAAQMFTGLKTLDVSDIISQSVGISEDGILFLATTEAVFDYDLTRNTMSERFHMTDIGITIMSGSTRFLPLLDGRVLFADRYPFDQKHFQLIRPMTDDEVAAKMNEPDEAIVITVGLTGPVYGTFMPLVAAYNMANHGIQIEVKEYFDGGSLGNNKVLIELLNKATFNLELDIIRGQSPDIVITRQALSWNRYAELGIFEDLYPWLEADPLFNWEEHYENHIRAFELQGKLYGFPLWSFPQTLIVRQAVVGERVGWNIDEFIAFVDSFDSDHTVFADPTKTAVLELCLIANGDILVDWSSEGADVGFNRDFITKVLAFANRFIDDERYVDNTRFDIRAQNGEIRVYVPEMRELFTEETMPVYQSLFGEPISFMAFPSERGSGNIISTDWLVSLSSQCRDKEAAWHFLSHYFSESMRSKEFIMEYIESRRGVHKRYSDHASGIIEFHIDDNAIDSYHELLQRDMQIRIYDPRIEDIIKEEAAPYFSGDKTLDEVVDIIANRVSVYVNESR